MTDMLHLRINYDYQKGNRLTETIPYDLLKQAVDNGERGAYKLREMLGISNRNDGKPTIFNYSKYLWAVGSPFMISNKCCDVMKKSPVHTYTTKTGRRPMLATMATESKLRTTDWIRNGCNGFNMKRPRSTPMSFWTEQDVLLYIYQHKIPIASVYGEVIKEKEVDGQLDFEDLGIFDLGLPMLKTTGCKRTGCMFCGFGCHLEKPGEGRFERMKLTHPKQYAYLFGDGKWMFEIRNANGSKINVKRVPYSTMMKWAEQNKDNPNFVISKRYVPDKGLGYKEVIDWLNEHGNLDIRY